MKRKVVETSYDIRNCDYIKTLGDIIQKDILASGYIIYGDFYDTYYEFLEKIYNYYHHGKFFVLSMDEDKIWCELIFHSFEYRKLCSILCGSDIFIDRIVTDKMIYPQISKFRGHNKIIQKIPYYLFRWNPKYSYIDIRRNIDFSEIKKQYRKITGCSKEFASRIAIEFVRFFVICQKYWRSQFICLSKEVRIFMKLCMQNTLFWKRLCFEFGTKFIDSYQYEEDLKKDLHVNYINMLKWYKIHFGTPDFKIWSYDMLDDIKDDVDMIVAITPGYRNYRKRNRK